MLINLSEILSTPAKREEYSVELDMKVLNFQGNSYEFEYLSPVKLKIENIGLKRISIKGTFKVTLNVPCDRCLDNVLYKIDVEIDKDIDFKNTDKDKMEELSEMSFIEGGNLDVDMLVRDEIVLMLPMKVLCKDDCKGICSVCGANLNKGECGCDRTVLDPRMSAIRDIFNNFKEV